MGFAAVGVSTEGEYPEVVGDAVDYRGGGDVFDDDLSPAAEGCVRGRRIDPCS